jgi:UDP-2,3-diacylglucosamine pyrophosphatase LpxH
MRPQHNVLVISDLHLGESLRAEAGAERAGVTDDALISFLDHHSSNTRDGLPWHLVINGDMIDFVAVRLMPDEAGLVAGLTVAEHYYGLADGARAAQAKMMRVLRHHQAVFQAMARFVGAGHRVSVVTGNHDAAFHWVEVQSLFRHALIAHSMAQTNDADVAAHVHEAISFHQWFWFEPGVAWIEHGHQYDPYNSFEDVLAPATRPAVLDENLGGALMRYIGNHYCNDMEGLWGRGFFGYLEFWVGQGLRRAGDILGAYRDMVSRLVGTWWQRRPERVAARRRRNRGRMERLAVRARLPVEVLLRLRSLHMRPVVSGLDDLVRAVMLDRLALAVAVPVLSVVVVVLQPAPVVAALGMGAILGPLATLSARPRQPVNPERAMRRVAEVIRRLVRVPVVVFGHSHAAVAETQLGYYNTGSWVPHGGATKAFTHLLILRTKVGIRATLRRWDPVLRTTTTAPT